MSSEPGEPTPSDRYATHTCSLMMPASCSTASSTVVVTSNASSSNVSSRKKTIVFSFRSAKTASSSSVEGNCKAMRPCHPLHPSEQVTITMRQIQRTVRRGPALAERLRQFQALAAVDLTLPSSASSFATPCMYSDTRLTKSWRSEM